MLDNVNAILEADHLGVIKATEMLGLQCEQAWEETKDIQVPDNYQDITNVVVAGMGGSHLGAQLINAVYEKELKVPLHVQNDYSVPGFVTDKTLVLATSFSGTTEEVLTFIKGAEERGAKIICISSGGTLTELAKEKGYPYYSFESTYNPSRIPRYGSGYLFIAQLSFLSKAGVISFTHEDVNSIKTVIAEASELFNLGVATDTNPAKILAWKLQNRAVMLVASEHLVGSAYIFKNQINESAKQFSSLFEIPELNHHLLEGLANPTSNDQYLSFVCIESDLYNKRVKARYQITKEIIDKQGIEVESFSPTSLTPLTQAFETLTFTSYVAVYLSILNRVDPGPNPWVDYLKDELKKIEN